MNRGRGTGTAGYTIVETLIFLAVSGAMFVSAMTFLSGKQGRTEFRQAVSTFQATLEDAANDVSTGYYGATVNGQTVSCSANSGGITNLTTVAADSQGANKDCIFVGKAIQFGPSEGNPGESYRVLPLAGKRLTNGTSGTDVSSYSEAKPTAIAPQSGHTGWPDATKLSSFGMNVQVKCMFYSNTAGATVPADKPCLGLPAGAVSTDLMVFMTTFKGINGAGQIEGGSSQVDLLVPAAASTLGNAEDSAITRVKQFASTAPVKNPAGGIFVCLQSGGSKQFSLIKMGGSGSRFTVSMPILQGSCV